jgi:hypothetical protein
MKKKKRGGGKEGRKVALLFHGAIEKERVTLETKADW